MSVINDVLVELEKRRASPEERRGISNHVRALPVVKEPGRVRLFMLIVGAAVAIAAIGWFLFDRYFAYSQGVTREPAASASVPAPVAPQAPVSQTPSPVEVPSEAVMVGRLTLELSRDPEVMPDRVLPPLPRASRDVAPTAAIPTARVVAPREPKEERQAEPAAKPVREESPVHAAPAPTPQRQQGVARAAPEPAKAADTSADIDKQVRRPTAAQQAETEYGRALQSLQQGRTADAREHLGVALRLNAEHVAARQTLLGIMVQSKQFPDAERLMQEGLKVLPGQTRFTVTLARLQVDRGDVAAALDTLQVGLPYAQGNAEYSAFFAGLLQRKQRHAEAVQQFQQALQARPQTGLWWLGLAMSFQALAQKAEAQDAYRRALATNNLSADMQAFADQQLRQLN